MPPIIVQEKSKDDSRMRLFLRVVGSPRSPVSWGFLRSTPNSFLASASLGCCLLWGRAVLYGMVPGFLLVAGHRKGTVLVAVKLE